MKFCEFLKILHGYIGAEKTQADFIIFITTEFLREPYTDEEEIEEENDLYNPLNKLKQRSLERIYSGESGHKISKKNARVLKSRFSSDNIKIDIENMDFEVQDRFIAELNKNGIIVDRINCGEVVGDTYFNYLNALVEGKDYLEFGEKKQDKNPEPIPESNEPTTLEVKAFVINHEDEMKLLILCVISESVSPLHKHFRKIYNDFQLLKSDSRIELLKREKVPALLFSEGWVDNCIQQFENDVVEYRLSEHRQLLYDNAKYLHRALFYSSHLIRNIDPYIFTLPITSRALKTALEKESLNWTLGTYIDQYLGCKNENLQEPLDALWNNADLGNCSEEEMCFWTMRFIVSACACIQREKKEEAKISIDEYDLETMEDFYYYTLLCLHETYI
ncbi:MAG: hypothetical protein II186_00930 [Erysipelotrichales bacterium]|nr:hypothetical protein [Erysipelotrichales bacterium]